MCSATMVEGASPPSTRVEYAQADLCRQELLVEIEGLATLSTASDASLSGFASVSDPEATT